MIIAAYDEIYITAEAHSLDQMPVPDRGTLCRIVPTLLSQRGGLCLKHGRLTQIELS